MNKIPTSVKSALIDWGFTPDDDEELKWKGVVPAADKFRLYASFTRWSGLLDTVSITQIKKRVE